MSTQSNNNNIKTENINSANNNSNNNMEEPMPPFDYFAWLMIGLSAAIVFGSAYYYKRSKQDLRKTIEMLDTL
jgi:hypothetical protein